LRKPGKVSATLPTLLPLNDFLSLPHPLHQPPSLASRFIARPLWWALSKVNPLGADKDVVTKVDSEEVSWKSLGKNTVFVHLELLEVSRDACRFAKVPRSELTSN
jgi:charged multivesicular body protein 7